MTLTERIAQAIKDTSAANPNFVLVNIAILTDCAAEIARLEGELSKANTVPFVDWTSPLNIEWIQSAVDYSHDATIQNAWSEMQSDARMRHSQLRDALIQLATKDAEIASLTAKLKQAEEALEHLVTHRQMQLRMSGTTRKADDVETELAALAAIREGR
jgi:hypothetical protein